MSFSGFRYTWNNNKHVIIWYNLCLKPSQLKPFQTPVIISWVFLTTPDPRWRQPEVRDRCRPKNSSIFSIPLDHSTCELENMVGVESAPHHFQDKKVEPTTMEWHQLTSDIWRFFSYLILHVFKRVSSKGLRNFRWLNLLIWNIDNSESLSNLLSITNQLESKVLKYYPWTSMFLQLMLGQQHYKQMWMTICLPEKKSLHHHCPPSPWRWGRWKSPEKT